MLYNVPLVVLPILIISLITAVYSSKHIIDNTQYHTEEMLGQIEINIDAYIQANDSVISYFSGNEYVLEYLKLTEQQEEKRLVAETKVREAMDLYKSVYSEVSGILIVPENGKYISNEMYRVSRESLKNDRWYKTVVQAEPGIVLISKPIGRNIKHWQDIYPEDVVSIAKSIYDPETNEFLGVISIDMKIEVLEEALKNLTLGKKGFVFIMDQYGEVVYSPTNEAVYRIKPSWIDNTSNTKTYMINDKAYSIMTTNSSYTNWTTIGVFEQGFILPEVKDLIYIILIIACVMLIVVILSSTVLASTISQPIKELQQLMQKAENGDLTVRFEGGNSDEVIKLGQNFNHMIFKIQELLKVVYLEQRNKRKAELNILQQQIKPHFLYNTLDTIQWMAQEHGMNDIVKIVNALSSMFRISISRGKEFITMEEEIKHLESYLTIQKMRYEDKVSYTIKKDPELNRCIVVKLILQPIVENAIYHGIKQKLVNGHIWIDIRRDNDMIVITVADDGVGMSEEQVTKLNMELENYDRTKGTHGYGIFNVNDRLRLFFGDDYKLRFIYFETGAMVKVTLPMITSTEMLNKMTENSYSDNDSEGREDQNV